MRCAYRVDFENVGREKISGIAVVPDATFEIASNSVNSYLVPDLETFSRFDGRRDLGELLPGEKRSFFALSRYSCRDRHWADETFGLSLVHNLGVAEINYYPDLRRYERFFVENSLLVLVLCLAGVVLFVLILLSYLYQAWKIIGEKFK
jgi:hypothetical protein